MFHLYQPRKPCHAQFFPCRRRPGAMAQVTLRAISQSPTRIDIFLDSRFTGSLLRKSEHSKRWIFITPNGEIQVKLLLSRLRPKVEFLALQEQPQCHRPWNHSILEWTNKKEGIRWIEKDHSLLRISNSQVMYPPLAVLLDCEPILHRSDPMDMTVLYRRCSIAPVEDDICVIATAIMARYLWSRASPNWLCAIGEYIQCFATQWCTKNIELNRLLQTPPSLPPSIRQNQH